MATRSRVPLWRRPPTEQATLCNVSAWVFRGGALCPIRTTCESMSLSACAWQQSACNWWATFVALLCSGISLGWRGHGQPKLKTGQPVQVRTGQPPLRLSRLFLSVMEFASRGRRLAFLMSTCAAGMSSASRVSSPFCIALNRSRGRRQEGVEPLPYDGVALAGCLFETGTIQNLHLPPTIAD